MKRVEIKPMLERLDITQKQMANDLGIPASTLCAALKGRRTFKDELKKQIIDYIDKKKTQTILKKYKK